MKVEKKSLWLISGVVFLIMFYWDVITPLFADDLYYTKENLRLMLHQAKTEYFGWNGRVFGQTFFRILSSSNQVLAAFGAAAFLVILLILMLQLSENKTSTYSMTKYFLTIALFFIFAPAFAQTVLWRAGIGNYLILTVISLLFIQLWLNEFRYTRKEKKFRLFRWGMLTVLALISGWSNENTAGGTFLVLILFSVFEFFEHKKMNFIQILSLVIFFLAYIALLVSPGGKKRTELMVPDYFKQSIWTHFVNGFTAVNNSILNMYVPLIVTVIIVLVLMIYFWYSRILLVQSSIWIIAGFAIIYALSFSPLGQDGGRAYFGGVVFILIGILSALPNFKKVNMKPIGAVVKILTVFTFTFATLTFFRGFADSLQTSAAIRTRYSYILRQKDSHRVISVPRLSYYSSTKYGLTYNSAELGKDPNGFPNRGYQLYFGVKGVIIK